MKKKEIYAKKRWRDRYVEQWRRIENLEIDQCKYAQLIFCKGAKLNQWRKDILFNK